MLDSPLFADYETRGLADLRAVGATEYLDQGAEILMVGVARETGVPVIWDRLGSSPEYGPVVSWGPFDRLVYERLEGGAPDEWVDTQALALYCGLPRSLEAFCRSVGIDAKKDPRGTRLINLYSRPQEDGTFRELSGSDRTDFEQYCLQDVELLRQAWTVLSPLYPEWRRTQKANYEAVYRMNENGVPIDRESVETALIYIASQEANLTFEFKALTDGISPNQVAALAEWFGTPDVQRDTLLGYQFDDPKRQKARDIRLQLGNAAVKKLVPMLEASRTTGRVRGCFINNGAHTGRCTSSLVQFQNLKRSKTDESYFNALKAHREPVNPLSEAQNNIRGFIKPPEGRVLVVADYAQVEARVLAWMSRDEAFLNVFRSGEDPYKRFASLIFNKPVQDITDHERQLGKIDILGSGFGVAGPGLARQALNYGVTLTENQAWKLVNLYRATFPGVPELWQSFNSGLSWLVRGVVESFEAGRCEFTMNKSRKALVVTLPSGRRLRYMFPSIEDGQVVYTARLGVNTTRKRLWGGHVTENLCQAIAADLKFDVMTAMQGDLIAEVHDEIILEVPSDRAEKALFALTNLMQDPPDWLDEAGLIKAEGKIMERYSK